MRFEGRIQSWNAERGYGFIEPEQGGQEIFVHINAIPTALRPPKTGQAFSFEVELNRQGKKRVANVGISQQRRARNIPPAPRSGPVGVASILAIPLFAFVFIAVAFKWRVSAWVALLYFGLSIICLIAYAADKHAARTGGWRSSEKSLLLLGLAGGWPGAIVAQQVLRHKSRKVSFQTAFRGTVLLNVAGFVFIHSPLGASLRS